MFFEIWGTRAATLFKHEMVNVLGIKFQAVILQKIST